jgi:hypothetical protein
VVKSFLTYLSSNKSHSHPQSNISGYLFLPFINGLYDTITRIRKKKNFIMPQGYGCADARCQHFYTEDLSGVIEHVRRAHNDGLLKRPHALGTPDTHGHLWYCFECDSRSGNDHSSYDSDQAMWDHLSRCHEYCVSTIENLI